MILNPVSDLISKDLRRWFKEKWVDVSRKDKDGKHPPCGRDEAKTDSKGYPKCRPSKKVSDKTPKTSRSMSQKDKKAATRRKRSKPQGVGGKPTVVKSILKDFYFGNRGLSAGEFTGPIATATTREPDHIKRPTKGLGKLFAGKKVWDSYSGADTTYKGKPVTYDANPSSENTEVTGDGFTDELLGVGYRTDKTPYTQEELQNRGLNATPNNAEFRRGGSLPQTKTVRTDTPGKSIITYVDKDGNEIRGYDKTGKKYLKNNINLPRTYEGQERDYTTHLGVNLASYGPKNVYAGKYNEDDAIESIISTLTHEYGHEAIDDELKQAVKRGELPGENINLAHEIGAHTLQEFGDEKEVNRALKNHPNTSAFRGRSTPEAFRGKGNQVTMPKPIDASPVKKSFEAAWDSITKNEDKGKFRGYSRSNISDRPYRQAEHRVWDVSRKVKRERTKRRYKRNKSRGTVRPAMRRQLGAGGKRASTKR